MLRTVILLLLLLLLTLTVFVASSSIIHHCHHHSVGYSIQNLCFNINCFKCDIETYVKRQNMHEVEIVLSKQQIESNTAHTSLAQILNFILLLYEQAVKVCVRMCVCTCKRNINAIFPTHKIVNRKTHSINVRCVLNAHKSGSQRKFIILFRLQYKYYIK